RGDDALYPPRGRRSARPKRRRTACWPRSVRFPKNPRCAVRRAGPMTDPAAEFSRLVPLAGLTSGGYRQQIAAETAEREALAARDRFSADVVLRRQADGIILLDAAFEAAFVQSCVVTLEPVRGTLSERFTLRYGPPGTAEADATATAEDAVFEPLVGDFVDI